MNVLIVEDEPLGVERLQQQLYEIDAAIKVQGVSESIGGAVKWLQQHEQPHLIFMDIELVDGQSFDIFRQTEVKSPVIFTTSYDEYALQAFKVNSIDYLLKPIRKEDLRRSIEKFRQLKEHFATPAATIENLLQEIRRQQQPQSYRSRFLVKQGQRLLTVDVADIAYCYAEGRVVHFKTWSQLRYVLDYTLEELEAMLNPDQFNRINRGIIAHIKSIAKVHPYFNGKLKLELQPATDKEVLVSKEYAGAFKTWLGK